MSWHFFTIKELEQQRAESGLRYLEFLREPNISSGVYVLPAGASDEQKPHHEDEIYYVLRGRAHMKVGIGGAAEDHPVGPGSVIFVEARAEHRFHSIEEELVVLVFFGPEEK
jgi:mannose-6-phosphate isomerase-like protein (cupin superfamily)